MAQEQLLMKQLFTLLLFVSSSFCLPFNWSSKLPYRYFSNNDLLTTIRRLSQNYPHISRTYSIGKSIHNVSLLVVEITDKPGNPGRVVPGSPTEDEELEPNVKYIGNIHGNEVVGRNVLLRLVEYLLTSYGRNHTITKLINTTRLHILCAMNPDGFARGNTRYGRYNANLVDLNRNFKDPYEKRRHPIQPETRAVMDWFNHFPFVLSAGLHGGALVANFPFDNVPPHKKQKGWMADYAPSPDDDVFVNLAKSYALTHPTMTKQPQCRYYTFKDGITNGADWYTISGGMQDYNYIYTNCFEITIEMSCVKFPHPKTLERFWHENRDPLLVLLQGAHMGVKGVVMDTGGEGISRAGVRVLGRAKMVYTWWNGVYWRLLLPGVYTLEVSAEGYVTSSIVVEVVAEKVKVLNFYLQPLIAPPVTS